MYSSQRRVIAFPPLRCSLRERGHLSIVSLLHPLSHPHLLPPPNVLSVSLMTSHGHPGMIPQLCPCCHILSSAVLGYLTIPRRRDTRHVERNMYVPSGPQLSWGQGPFLILLFQFAVGVMEWNRDGEEGRYLIRQRPDTGDSIPFHTVLGSVSIPTHRTIGWTVGVSLHTSPGQREQPADSPAVLVI